MHKKRVPEVLWCYCLEYVSEVLLQNMVKINELTLYESLTRETPDISEYIEFEFHDWVKYWDPRAKMPGEQLGKWLGVCKNVGAAMTYSILKDNGQVVARSALRNLHKDEWLDEVEKQAQLDFNKV